MGRKRRYLIIHCTATPEGREVYPEDIERWHTSPKPLGRGWKQVGYSEMILLDGKIENLVPYDEDDEVDSWEITNGVAGYNSVSTHIVYVGGTDRQGKPKDTRTSCQKKTLEVFVKNFIAKHPYIKVAGHYQFNSGKACPSFNVPEWLREIGVKEENIL